jgi:hypothetical protein
VDKVRHSCLVRATAGPSMDGAGSGTSKASHCRQQGLVLHRLYTAYAVGTHDGPSMLSPKHVAMRMGIPPNESIEASRAVPRLKSISEGRAAVQQAEYRHGAMEEWFFD